MDMSTYIIGLRDPNSAHHKNMVAVRRACDAASVDWPKQVTAYFDEGEDDTEDGPLMVNLEKVADKWSEEDLMREGFELDIKKIPHGITKIRFYNSW